MVSNELRPYDACVLPPQASAIEELFDWSVNFDSGRNPYVIFLDLIGYSDEVFGCNLFASDKATYSEVLGYKELVMLGDALKCFTDNGYAQVYDWCRKLED